jgi:hypothetical protein
VTCHLPFALRKRQLVKPFALLAQHLLTHLSWWLPRQDFLLLESPPELAARPSDNLLIRYTVRDFQQEIDQMTVVCERNNSLALSERAMGVLNCSRNAAGG